MVEKDNPIKTKSYAFAVRIVKLRQYLNSEKKEFDLSKQVLRSGTSIGANISEGGAGQSKKDFIAKLSIALKEAHETRFWLCLLKDSDYLDEERYNSLLKDCEELIIILTSILRTARINS